MIVVDAPAEVQLERMLGDRGWTREDAESRMRAQASREERLALATYVVENTGTREDLRRRVAEVFAEVVSAGRPAELTPGRLSTQAASGPCRAVRAAQAARSGSANLRSLAIASRSS